MQSVGNIYPGTYLACLGHAGNQCERERGSSGALRSNHLTEGSHRESAMKQEVYFGNPCWHNRVGNTGHRGERRWNSFRQGSFYLCAQMAGGWHGLIFALFSPVAGLQCQPMVVGKARLAIFKRLKT